MSKWRLHRSAGSITLFAVVILMPILFFLLTLTLDLTQLYANRVSMQRLIDEAALYGYRFLPFQRQAELAIEGYLRDLNLTAGTYKSSVSNDAVEIIYRGVAPFTFAAFAGRKTGMPYELRSKVRGSTVHAALLIDSGERLAPASQSSLWGSEGAWPAALLFSHFAPFGSTVLPRFATQQCHNPYFSGLKKAALGVFDFLSSFSKNSVGVAFFPGTLSQVDSVKNAERPGRSPTDLSTGYFNIANSSHARNSYCLALMREEGLESPYRMVEPEEFDSIRINAPSFFTDPLNHLVPDTALSDISVREIIWSRAVRAGSPTSIRLLLSRMTEMLTSAGKFNPFERQNRIAELPTKVGIIMAAGLPTEGGEEFPALAAKDAIREELRRFWTLLAEDRTEEPDSRALQGRIYYVIFKVPGANIDLQAIRELQAWLNGVVIEEGFQNEISIRIVYGDHESGVSKGIIHSLVIENNTAVVDG